MYNYTGKLKVHETDLTQTVKENELFSPTLLATVLFKTVHLHLISFEIHAIKISKLAVFILMMHMEVDDIHI